MCQTAPVSQRTLAFVDRLADAGPPDPSTDVVVLDTTWTPEAGGRLDLISLRPALASVLRDVELFDGSLARLDAWAATANLADRFLVDGVTWWYRIRMKIRWNLHELMLWRHILELLAPPGRYGTIRIPSSHPALLQAARSGSGSSGTPVILIRDDPSERTRRRSKLQMADLVRSARSVPNFGRRVVRSLARRLRRRLGMAPAASARTREVARRAALLDARVDALRTQPGGVLAVASAGFFQLVWSNGRGRFVDPHLALVLDRLAEDGCGVTTVALTLDHRRDSDWEQIERDDRLLPDSMIVGRWAIPEDDTIESSDVAARLVDIGRIPIDVAGADLGPAIGSVVADQAGPWLDSQRRWTRLAERLLSDLRPAVLLVDHEGVRTLWLAAARRLGIPIVAIQHGVIYRNNPEYCHPRHPGLVRPEMTCMFGTYERDILIGMGGYDPTEVIVTGSSRADPDAALVPGSPDEREDVRRSLGVADGDRLLVVSVAHNPVAGDLHSVNMVAQVLGGPLPGVHVVIKRHPQDKVEGTYEALMSGLARAGGYPMPSLTVVRDIDLYQLLRAADAHLGQYSTVLTDAVVAGRPNMIAVGQAYADILGYVDARVAVPVRSVDDVRAFMRAPRPPEREDRARFLEQHYRRGDATGRIVAAIRAAMDPTRDGPGDGTGGVQ